MKRAPFLTQANLKKLKIQIQGNESELNYFGESDSVKLLTVESKRIQVPAHCLLLRATPQGTCLTRLKQYRIRALHVAGAYFLWYNRS